MTASGFMPALLLVVLLLGLAAAEPSANLQGSADCFAQILAASLARLTLNNAYVCTLSKNGVLTGLAVDSYNAFGPNHGYPTLQGEDESFFESYYGSSDGRYVAVARVNSTSNSGIGYYMANVTSRVSYLLDSNGQLTDTLNAIQDYDVNVRPWFVGAVNSESGDYVTTTPYRFSLNTLRVTSARVCTTAAPPPPVRALTRVVAGADITLDVLATNALTSARCPLFNSDEGVVLVVNAKGELLMRSGEGVPEVVNATEIDGLIGAAARQVEALNQGQWYSAQSGVFTFNGVEYSAFAYPIDQSNGGKVDLSAWGWTVITVQRSSTLCGASTSAASALLPPLHFIM